jgi:hypothetical protein
MDGGRRGWTRFGLASFVGALGIGMGSVVVVGACSSDPAGNTPADGGPNGEADVSAHTSDAPTGTPLDSYRSGHRLRAEVLRAGDAVRFEQFFDTKRNEPCSFWETIPGEYRCLPSWTIAKYADSTCGTPAVAHLSSCAPDLEYAAVTVAPTDCTVQHRVSAIHPVGDVAEGGTYEKLVDGQCTQVIPSEGMVRRILGPEIPLTEFVKATSAAANVTTDLAVERLLGEDGSELTRDRIIDRTRDAGCGTWVVGAPGATSIACIPGGPVHAFEESGPWANASCSTLAARAFAPTGCLPGTVVVRHTEIDGGACGPQLMRTIHERGAALPTLYEGAECTLASPPPGIDFFAVGPELPVSVFPAIDETLFGTGRLRVMAYAKAGVELGTSSFYDTSSRTDCVPAPFTDNKLRCVPHDARHYVLKDRFKDPSCLQPIHLESPCHPATLLVDGTSGCGGAGFDVNVFPLGAPFELASYYVKSATSCDPIANDGLVANDVLAPVPASQRLIEVARVRE